ncbi:MAG: histidine phosphatase family protein [Candidatus Woesebacteria bacterium]|nr:MAG: histidine phosphatase family protein [Candidatus Woesebacteria bacterium]
MKIYLIRHGQTTGDVENRYGGSYDDDLSNEGEVQAQELADKLSNSGIQSIFCSPLKRAQQTAGIINAKLNCDIKTIEDLKERNQNGILSGMIRDEAKTKYPELVEQVKDYKNTIEGAESYENFVERIKKIFTEIAGSANYSTIGIVTHGGPIRVIFREILKDREIDIADCAYAVIDKEEQKLILEKLDGIEYKTD